MSTNKTIIQQALSVLFNIKEYTTKERACLSETFEVPAGHLDHWVKGYLINNLRLEDLGEYFYDSELFNEYKEIEDTQFLIYNYQLNYIAGVFMDEFLEKCEELGIYSVSIVNELIWEAVINHHEQITNN